MDMNPLLNKINSFYGAIIAVLSFVFGEQWALFVAYLFLNVGDYVTRWLAARLTGTENSRAGCIGILKKVGYWIMIAVAFGMSAIFMEIGKVIGVNLKVTTFFGWFVLCSLILNEIRSILENLVEAGYNVPNILIKGLDIVNKAVVGKIKIGDDGIEIESHLSHDELKAKGKATMTIEDNRTSREK